MQIPVQIFPPREAEESNACQTKGRPVSVPAEAWHARSDRDRWSKDEWTSSARRGLPPLRLSTFPTPLVARESRAEPAEMEKGRLQVA